MTPETWMNKNTIRCPLGRVSKKMCERLCKRPTLAQVTNTKNASWGLGVVSTPTKPLVCEACKGWDYYAKNQTIFKNLTKNSAH